MALHIQDGGAYPWPDLTPPHWADRAACVGKWDLFYPEAGAGPNANQAAKALCATCPVRAACFEAGMTEHEGVWGGTSPTDRRRIRAQRRTALSSPVDNSAGVQYEHAASQT